MICVCIMPYLFISVAAQHRHLRGNIDSRRLEDAKPLEFLKIGPLSPTASAAANAVAAGYGPSTSPPAAPASAPNPAAKAHPEKVPQVANEGKAPGEITANPALQASLRSDLPHTFNAMKFLKSGPNYPMPPL